MTIQDSIRIVKGRINSKKWQILNEDRTDKDCLQEEVNKLEMELKGLQSKLESDKKWDNWFENPKAKIISKEWDDDDYDNEREAEEATEIALSNLE